jgi:hypothetical protein
MVGETQVRRARGYLLTGLSGVVSAIGLSLGTQGWFAPTAFVLSAVVAGIGLHRFGRSGARALG